MYAIAILHNEYGRDTQVKMYAANENATTQYGYDLYDTIEEAQEIIDDMEADDYVLSHNEAGRPDYYIVDDNDADYVATGRGGDESNYDWSDCSCTRNNGDCCGECDECIDIEIEQDREYIIDNAVTA
jgi:hypothetical protein